MTPVVVLGASRLIGQTLLSLLAGHPWLSVVALGDLGPARDDRAFADACAWALADPMPADLAAMPHRNGDAQALAALAAPGMLVLSVLPDGQSAAVDRACAAAGARVITHGEDLRLADDVPLVIPEMMVPPPSAPLVATPNCTTVMLALALEALRPVAAIDAVMVTCLQALSGADLPGPPAMMMADNVDPHLRGEEAALERETARLFGGGFPVSAQATRVPVLVGHTLTVSVRLSRAVTAEDLAAAWAGYTVPAGLHQLPSVVAQPIRVADADARPCPNPDRDAAGGMGLTIGAIRPCPVLDWRFVLVGNNMIRGSAGMSVLTAEWLIGEG